MVHVTSLAITTLFVSTALALRETYSIIDRNSTTTWDHLHYTDPLFERTGAYYNGFLHLNWTTPNTTACPQDAHRLETWHAIAWIGPPANSSEGSTAEENPFQLWIAAWPPTMEFEEEMSRKYGWPERSSNESSYERTVSTEIGRRCTEGTATEESQGPPFGPLPYGLPPPGFGQRTESQEQPETSDPPRAFFKHRPPFPFPPLEYIASKKHLEEGQVKDKVLKFFPFEYDTSLYGWKLNSQNGAPEYVSEIYCLQEQPSHVPPFLKGSGSNSYLSPSKKWKFNRLDGVDHEGLNFTTYGFRMLPAMPTKAYEDVLGVQHMDMLRPDPFSNHVLHRSFCSQRDRNFRTTISVDKLKEGMMPWGTGFDEGRFFSLEEGTEEEVKDGKGRSLKEKRARQRFHFGGDRRIQYNDSAETEFENMFFERLEEYQKDETPWFANRSTFSSAKNEDFSVFDLRFDFQGFFDTELSTNMPRFIKRENCSGAEFVWTRWNDARKTIAERLKVVENVTIVEEEEEDNKNEAGKLIGGVSRGLVLGAMIAVAVSWL